MKCVEVGGGKLSGREVFGLVRACQHLGGVCEVIGDGGVEKYWSPNSMLSWLSGYWAVQDVCVEKVQGKSWREEGGVEVKVW